MEATRKRACQILPFPSDVSSADFDPDFVWGAATSSYQIEGAATEGGRGPSIWDAFCLRNPGAIVDGENGNTGNNAYFKTKEDVQLMKKMGLKAYRFSLSWSRILPGGRLHMGINREGVDYYNDLINELIANGIEPYITLWHWDTPNALEEEYGGFLSEKIICDFMAYAEFCFWEFGDRVKHWITLNEPHSYSVAGYALGTFAPGRGGSNLLNASSTASGCNRGVGALGATKCIHNGSGNPATEPYIVAHNLLLSHATAVKLYRERFQASQGGKIGITLNTIFFEPLNPKYHGDKDAALRALDFIFGWFMEPCTSGKYPDTMIKNVTGGRLPEFTKEQAKLLKGSYDFLGLNYYVSQFATTAEPSEDKSYLTDSLTTYRPEALDGKTLIGVKGGVDWFYSYPPGLYRLLLHIKNTYGDPLIYITENGWADKRDNTITIEEARVDIERVVYYNEHLKNLRDAIRDGVRVEGYFAWSFMDNFEWNEGYSVRFGLVYVDYKDGKYTRYPKNSALWFMNFLKNSEKLKVDSKKRIAATASTEPTKRTRK